MFDFNGYWVEFGGAKNGYFKRNIMLRWGDPDFFNKYNNFMNEYGRTDVYQCVYKYSSQNIEEAKLYAPFYLDLDGSINTKKGFSKLKQDVLGVLNYFMSLGFTENDINIFFSGSKGFHIIIDAETLGIVPATDLNALYKAWALYLYNTINIKSIDLRIYDKRRLLRIEGTINSKTGLYKIQLLPSELHKLTYDNLEKSAKNWTSALFGTHPLGINKVGAVNFYKKSQNFYRKAKKQVREEVIIPKVKLKLLPCIDDLLQNGADKGSRNNTLVLLASAILQSGYALAETLDMMHNWNIMNNPPLSHNEVETTTRSAYSMLLSGKKYGCSAFKESGYCVDNNCKFQNKENLHGHQ